jgi:hypothetical protein
VLMRSLALLGGCVLALAACGSSGTTTAAKPTPQQYDHSQRDGAYVRALNQVMLPFTKPPASFTDYPAAERRLDTAIRGLGSLTVPSPFAASQAHLVMSLRAQVALLPGFEHAARTRNRVAANNLEAKLLRAEDGVRAATQEMVQAYNQCQRARFKRC